MPKADQDYADVNKLLIENTELTSVTHQLTEELHARVVATGKREAHEEGSA